MEAQGYQADITVKYAAAEQNVAQSEVIAETFLMVSFIVVLIVLIGLTSTLPIDILDRTKEIGMLRCIGAQSRDVRRVFSTEGLFLAFRGWIVSFPLGYVVYQDHRRRDGDRDEATMPPRHTDL